MFNNKTNNKIIRRYSQVWIKLYRESEARLIGPEFTDNQAIDFWQKLMAGLNGQYYNLGVNFFREKQNGDIDQICAETTYGELSN